MFCGGSRIDRKNSNNDASWYCRLGCLSVFCVYVIVRVGANVSIYLDCAPSPLILLAPLNRIARFSFLSAKSLTISDATFKTNARTDKANQSTLRQTRHRNDRGFSSRYRGYCIAVRALNALCIFSNTNIQSDSFRLSIHCVAQSVSKIGHALANAYAPLVRGLRYALYNTHCSTLHRGRACRHYACTRRRSRHLARGALCDEGSGTVSAICEIVTNRGCIFRS